MWREDRNSFGRRFFWEGPMAENVFQIEFDPSSKWVTEWTKFPRPSEEDRKKVMADYHAKQDAGNRCADITCACCHQTIRFGDARYFDTIGPPGGICSRCRAYISGYADGVEVSRRPTVEEINLLPRRELSLFEITLLEEVLALRKYLGESELRRSPGPLEKTDD